jgi:hypothetical protein
MKTAETLKAYADTCDDKPEYLFVCQSFSSYESFTFSGLNECPYRFRPAIAEIVGEYASQQNAELKAENERLRGSLRKIFKYMDDEVIVRNISKDHEDGWAMQILRLSMDLKEAHALINPEPIKH